jgi:hypothetical protein
LVFYWWWCSQAFYCNLENWCSLLALKAAGCIRYSNFKAAGGLWYSTVTLKAAVGGLCYSTWKSCWRPLAFYSNLESYW